MKKPIHVMLNTLDSPYIKLMKIRSNIRSCRKFSNKFVDQI